MMALFSSRFFLPFSILLALLGAPLDAVGMEPGIGFQIKEEFLDRLAFARRLVDGTEEDAILMQNPDVPLAARIAAAKRSKKGGWINFLESVVTNPEASAENYMNAAIGLRDGTMVMKKIQDPTLSEKILLETIWVLAWSPREGWREKAMSLLLDLCKTPPALSTLSESERGAARSHLDRLILEEHLENFHTTLYPLWMEMAKSEGIAWSERLDILRAALKISKHVFHPSAPFQGAAHAEQCLLGLKNMLQDARVPGIVRSGAAESIFLWGSGSQEKEALDILMEISCNPQNPQRLHLEAAQGVWGWMQRNHPVMTIGWVNNPPVLMAIEEGRRLEYAAAEVIVRKAAAMVVPFLKHLAADASLSMDQRFGVIENLWPLCAAQELKMFPSLLNMVKDPSLSPHQSLTLAKWIVGIVDQDQDYPSYAGARLENSGMEAAFSAFLENKLGTSVLTLN